MGRGQIGSVIIRFIINNNEYSYYYNNLQSLTTVNKTLNLQPFKQKIQSFGCKCHEVNGHSIKEINTYCQKKFQ